LILHARLQGLRPFQPYNWDADHPRDPRLNLVLDRDPIFDRNQPSLFELWRSQKTPRRKQLPGVENYKIMNSIIISENRTHLFVFASFFIVTQF
jgi:hypothetical protein